VRVEPSRLTITIAPRGDFKYTTDFVGQGGRVLATTGELTAVYTPRGDEGYVRAKVIESNGRVAWVQPVRISGSVSSLRIRSLWRAVVARLS